MKQAQRFVRSISLLALLGTLLVAGSASARPLATTITTEFTYQGNLTDGGVPANGAYDLTFRLYDAASSGNTIGPLVTKDDVAVTAGAFTVQLDFGDVFDGTALWLEISVRPGSSTGAYTALTPLQPLTATPYALAAAKAPWGGLIGVPAGFADGVDNGSSYQNLVVVAKSGGDFTSITDALNSITTAGSSNPFLIFVAPGVYSEHVVMKPYVDIRGSGELTTKISSTGFASPSDGTVQGASNAELSSLTVQNTGSAFNAIAIYNSGNSPRLTNITATASGGSSWNVGVYNTASSPRMVDVTSSASGGASAIGVYNAASSGPKLKNVTVSASGATSNYGVYYTLSVGDITGGTVSASGGTFAYGVFNGDGGSTLRDVVVSATGATENDGVFNTASSGSYSVVVTDSQITGSTSTISSDSEFTVKVGASQLSGGNVSTGGGIFYCAGVYDENMNMMYVNSCP